MLIVMAGLLLPLSVRAEDGDLPDGVILQQQEDRIEVLVSINHAHEDGISALSLKLKVDQAKTTADFRFEESLAKSGVAESLYESGTLSLYAASDEGLFPDNGLLKIGELKVMPEEDGKRLQISVQYVDGSLQAVNSGYGAISPIVRFEPEPVSMLVGEGVTYGSGDESGYTQPPVPETQGNSGASSGGHTTSGGAGQSGDRTQEGLYDENTQYVSDPAEAQNIPSGVIRSSSQAGLTDLSKAASGNNGLNLQAGGSAAGIPGMVQNVTVVSPADGPSGLLVSAGGTSGAGGTKTAPGTSNGTGMTSEAGAEAGASGRLSGESPSGNAAAGSGSAAAAGTAGGSVTRSISFDQENGGAAEAAAAEKEGGMRRIGRILIAVGLVCAIALATAAAVSAILRERRRRLRRKRALARAKARNRKKRAA